MTQVNSAIGLAKVDRDLDRAAVPLIRNRQERLAPLLQLEGVGQHGAQVDSSADGKVEVVRDRMLTLTIHLLDPECVGARPS